MSQSTEVPGEACQERFGKGTIEGRSPLQATSFASRQGCQLLEIHHQIRQGEISWKEIEPLGLASLSVVSQKELEPSLHIV